MATNNTVNLNIATTNTAKATKDVKSLKEQIRDLKNEMAQLTKGTEEYDAAAAELGNLMHTQQEITEAAKLATADYGQTLSNITSISAGVVGAISSVNGVMNLLGANTDEATEAMRKIQSLMAIVQGLNQLEAADKALRGLWTRIKTATAAKKEDTQETIKNSQSELQNASATNAAAAAKKQEAVSSGVAAKANGVLSVSFKNLGRAIKAFMASNPFTLIIMAVTTVISLVSSLISKQKELNEQIEKEAEAFKEAAESRALVDAAGGPSLDNTNYRQTGEHERMTAAGSRRLRPDSPEDEEAKMALARYRDQLNKLEKEDKKYSDEYNEIYTNLYYDQKRRLNELYFYFVNERNKYANWSEEKDLETRDKMLQHWQRYEGEIDKLLVQMGHNYYDYQQYLTDKQKEEQRKRDENTDNAANDYLKKIKQEFDLRVIEIERAYKNNEINTQEYYSQLIDAHTDYLEKYKKSKKKEALTVAQEEDAITDLRRKAALDRIEIQKRENTPYRPESDRASVYEKRYNDERNRLTDEQGGRYMEQQEELFNAWWWKKFRLMEQYNQREVEEEREHNDQLNRLAMEHYAEEERVLKENRDGDKNYEKAKFDNEMAYLNEKLNEKLISQQDYNLAVEQLEREHQERMDEIRSEYDSGVQELEANRIETLRDIAQQRYEIEKDYYDRRLELDQAYITAYQSLTSAIGGILSEAQQKYEEGSKQYEQIQEASIIMDTISGSLAAFMSGVKSGIPAPYNFILGGVLSLAALAEGKMALDNLHNKKLSAGASNAPSVSAYQVVAQETNAELSGQIQDQRVYVTETDIADTMARVNVIEAESTF